MPRVNQAQYEQEALNSLLPEQNFVFEVLSAEEKDNLKSSDGKMTKLSLVVIHDGRRRKVKDFLGMWEGGSRKFKQFFEAVGIDPNEGVDNVVELTGLTGTLKIKHGVFNGDPCENVAWYIPLRDGEQAPELPVVGQTEAPVTNDTTDDDVPF